MAIRLANATVNGQADDLARRLDNGYVRIYDGTIAGTTTVVAEPATVGRRGARFDRIPDRAKVTRSVPSREVPLPSIAAIASTQPSQRGHLRAVTSDDDLAYLYLELAA